MAPITWECLARVLSTLLPPVCFERYNRSWDITAGRSLFSYSGGFGGRDRTPVTAGAGCGTVQGRWTLVSRLLHVSYRAPMARM